MVCTQHLVSGSQRTEIWLPERTKVDVEALRSSAHAMSTVALQRLVWRVRSMFLYRDDADTLHVIRKEGERWSDAHVVALERRLYEGRLLV